MSLARYPKEGLLGLYDVTLEELMSIRGIGEVKAVRLKCLTELSMRMSMARASFTFSDASGLPETYLINRYITSAITTPMTLAIVI